MKNPIPIRTTRGQALVEMVLAIPLLFLFAAGLVQFSLLFLSYVQFEHACGEAARLYASHAIDKNSLGPKVEENLGIFRPYFDPRSLKVEVLDPEGTTADILEKVRSTFSGIPFIGNFVVNYDGAEWHVQIQFKPPFLLATLFPNGIPFQTTMQIYRYPQ